MNGTAANARSTSAHSMGSGRPHRWLAPLVLAAAVPVTAVIGGLAAADSRATYDALDLPPFAPPGWLFGPVWTVLYIAIALAGWLVWRRVGLDASIAMWAVQLVLNAAWTPLFFAADAYWLAFVEICLLWVAVAVTVVMFARRQRLAAVLLLPYLAWVTYAGALNLAIALTN
jgi:benzodiazapine receptor